MSKKQEAIEAFLKWTGEGAQTPNWEEENNDHFILKWVEEFQETIKVALQSKPVDVETITLEIVDHLTADHHLDDYNDLLTRIAVDCIDHLHAKGYLNTSQWQPIKTAPKDDKDIIVCNSLNGDRAISSYEDTKYRRCFNHRNGFQGATHWMPLPQPPEDKP